MYPHQAERLEAGLARLGVHALVAASPANVAYVTGFRRLSREPTPGTDVFAVHARSGTALVIPAIEAPAVMTGDVEVDHVVCHGRLPIEVAERADAVAHRTADIIAGSAPSPAEALAAGLRALGVVDGAVGLDAAALSESTARAVAERLESAKLLPATGAFAEARAVKGPYEIECLQQALWRTEEAINEVLGDLGTGATEREATLVYERALAHRGARPTATRIAFGANTALPVMTPGARVLRAGDLVRFQVGSVFKGYHAEVARMGVLGEPSARHQARYDAVEAGVDAALKAIRPGAPARTVLEAATAAMRATGIPSVRLEHVGHGVGLDAAEHPRLSIDGPDLEAGMVLAVEVGVYELGAAGVQVKETVLVNRDGAAVMNRSNRGLVLLD
jgi:Xaa-Pro aminopeptidase